MSALLDHLRRRIELEGPLTVAAYMQEALGHPRHGYYRRRDPLGRDGDFITAPEVSQMFGELLGGWLAVVWDALGRPDPVLLVELGPGRGTLAADILRAAGAVPGMRGALRLHLVETSPVLREKQAAALGDGPVWHEALDTVPEGPTLLVANEFFDALPIRQFQKTAQGWRERLVAWDATAGGLRFVLSPATAALPFAAPPAAEGEVVEVCAPALAVGREVGRRIAAQGGGGLIVDYGHARSAAGDTLQAVRGHAYHAVLAEPGEADITAHVDFQALGGAIRDGGASVFGPVPQGAFLESLGLQARAGVLRGRADSARKDAIDRACHRLAAPQAMGSLFKAMAVLPPDSGTPPGFA